MDRTEVPQGQGLSLTVQYHGETGSLTCEENSLCFEGVNSTSTSAKAGVVPCLPKSLGVKIFPWSEVIGATIEGHSGVRIWHCTPSETGSGPCYKLIQKLRKSDIFTCDSMIEAKRLVDFVQRTASWGGSQTAPHIVAIVNPASGQSKGQRVFTNDVLPLLRDVAGMRVDVHVTTGPGHVQIMRDLNLADVSLVLYVGGDGTLYEGMQGLMSRSDWSQAVKVPFGTVPMGSGNGIAGSLGIWDPVTAVHAACKRLTHPIDVASALQAPNKRYYLLLSVAYGMMANLDIGTMNLRWMGEARFTVGGIREIMSSRFYPLRAAVYPGPETEGDDSGVKRTTSSKAVTSPPSTQVLAATDDNTMTQSLLSADRASSHHLDTAPTTAHQTPATGPAASSTSEALQAYPTGPPLPILSQLGSVLPVGVPNGSGVLPEGWELLNDKGHLADGSWELMYISGLTGLSGKSKGISFLLGTETGTHVDMDIVRTQKVRAMILEPLAGDSTWLVLDGEEVPRQTLYLEVHPQLCTALVAPGFTPDMCTTARSARKPRGDPWWRTWILFALAVAGFGWLLKGSRRYTQSVRSFKVLTLGAITTTLL